MALARKPGPWMVLAGGAKEVRIAGQKVKVQALAASRPRVILTHGEDEPRKALHDCIQKRFGLRSEMPAYREGIEL